VTARATSAELRAAWRVYGSLPTRERLHVLARAISAPMSEMARRVPSSGRVLDVGCGHGLLTALLSGPGGAPGSSAVGQNPRSVVGIDPDARKVRLAMQALGERAGVTLRVGRIEDLEHSEAGGFDTVVICDVLYLLPRSSWVGFLARCRGLLRAGGTLLLKEAEGDGSWKHYKCLAQEWLMVRALGRTQGSGGLTLPGRAETVAILREAGLDPVEVVDLSRGFTTPHVLHVAVAPS
jgi:2-polyprenyl-3-methyl-5-hydroxy-6-metoxy-1,4-benzoquinol methylase